MRDKERADDGQDGDEGQNCTRGDGAEGGRAEDRLRRVGYEREWRVRRECETKRKGGAECSLQGRGVRRKTKIEIEDEGRSEGKTDTRKESKRRGMARKQKTKTKRRE